jgi:hypothetical protein
MEGKLQLSLHAHVQGLYTLFLNDVPLGRLLSDLKVYFRKKKGVSKTVQAKYIFSLIHSTKLHLIKALWRNEKAAYE